MEDGSATAAPLSTKNLQAQDSTPSNVVDDTPLLACHTPASDTLRVQDDHSHANTSSTPSLRLPSDFKRDSGIAASFTTPDTASYTQTVTGGASSVATRETTPAADAAHDAGSVTAEGGGSRLESSSIPDLPSIGSLKGPHSQDTPDFLAGISLADLASDRVAFSKRGSLLYSGKRMNKQASSNGDSLARVSADGPMPAMAPLAEQEKSATGMSEEEESKANGEKVTANIPTIQTPTPNSRILSPEEMTFSSRVRSMYAHGTERAASWTTPRLNGIHESDAEESSTTADTTPEMTSDRLMVEKTRQTSTDGQRSTRMTRPSLNKEANEFAGGIEDWEDIDGQDVDRYGFINPKRDSSRTSTGGPGTDEGAQRAGTRSNLQPDGSRKTHALQRIPSSAGRSSRSFTQNGQRGDNGGAGSIYSTRTQHANLNLPNNMFRSRDRRVVSQASDMLTLPPGLAQIAEAADGGRTASASKRKEFTREEKWQNMARDKASRRQTASKGGGMRFEFDTHDPKVISRTWKGIPDRWRATAWHSFLSSSARKRGVGASDDELVLEYNQLQEQGSADDVQIDMDVPRTISLHVMFRRRYRGGQRLLFRLLHAISLYFPDTGYVQGMASLAATLLCYFEEERAFIMMVRLWQLRGLEQLFAAGFGGLLKALEEFERDWLRHGDVAKKLDQLGIHSTAYGTRWYLTLFNMSIPFPAQLRVWDVFMLLGDAAPGKRDNGFGGADLDVLHATSAALVDATREIVLDSDFENAMKVLTSFVPVKDEDLLMRVAKAEWKGRKKRG